MEESRRLSKTQELKKRRRKYPNVFFKKELVGVFDNIDNLRTIMACFITFFCALRVSEIVNLKWKDIDLDEKRLKVVDGKNHKDGFIPISSACIPILRTWKEMNENEEYVIPKIRNDVEKYGGRALLFDLRRALIKANLNVLTEKNSAGKQQHQYKFHTLRHSRCTHLLSNGVPIEKVQKFMRHDEVDTTMTYTWILDRELNKMVEEVDGGKNSFPEELLKFNGIITNSEDPVILAQKRFVRGEISVKEYNKIIATLSSTNLIQMKANVKQNNLSSTYIS